MLALARTFRGRGVVGLDLCGDPAAPVGALAPVFEEARRTSAAGPGPGPGLGLTVHFAEAESSASDGELDLLLGWRPDRLGHVIHVGERVRREIVRRGGIGLELCLSCNVHAGMVRGGFEGQYVSASRLPVSSL